MAMGLSTRETSSAGEKLFELPPEHESNAFVLGIVCMLEVLPQLSEILKPNYLAHCDRSGTDAHVKELMACWRIQRADFDKLLSHCVHLCVGGIRIRWPLPELCSGPPHSCMCH